MSKQTINQIIKSKGKRRLSLLTCYDSSFAVILEQAGLDMILIGDSLANVVLGLKETNQVSLSEMIEHTRAVASKCQRTLVVADMPFVAYQKNPKQCLDNAKKFIAVGADAVKLEWFPGKIKGYDFLSLVKELVKNRIAVMAHIGLTPQTASFFGGFKVRGKDSAQALELINQAKALEKAGAFSIVLECLPDRLAGLITRTIKIPTIGCGAGKFCDAQVLVLYDILGLFPGKRPKFVRQYLNLSAQVLSACQAFKEDVKSAKYPSDTESFHISDEEWLALQKLAS